MDRDMAVDNNSNSMNDSYSDYGELITMCNLKLYHQITAASFIIIFCFSLLMNSLLLYILARFEDLNRVTMFFLLNLAIFDLLFTITLPLWATDHFYQWVFGNIACKILIWTYFMGIYGSLILLTAMTVDRYFAIVVRSPWLTHQRRLNLARAACICAWLISGGACLKEALSSKVILVDQIFTCNAESSEEDKTGYYTQFALLFLLPLLIIIFCYSRILHTLMSTSARQKYRTVLVVLGIVVAFFICWGPYHIVMIVTAVQLSPDCVRRNKLHQSFVICQIFAYSHCCVNPVLYMLRKKSRTILSSILFCSPELRQAGPEGRANDFSHSNILQHSVVDRADVCKTKEQNVTELKPV